MSKKTRSDQLFPSIDEAAAQAAATTVVAARAVAKAKKQIDAIKAKPLPSDMTEEQLLAERASCEKERASLASAAADADPRLAGRAGEMIGILAARGAEIDARLAALAPQQHNDDEDDDGAAEQEEAEEEETTNADDTTQTIQTPTPQENATQDTIQHATPPPQQPADTIENTAPTPQSYRDAVGNAPHDSDDDAAPALEMRKVAAHIAQAAGFEEQRVFAMLPRKNAHAFAEEVFVSRARFAFETANAAAKSEDFFRRAAFLRAERVTMVIVPGATPFYFVERVAAAIRTGRPEERFRVVKVAAPAFTNDALTALLGTAASPASKIVAQGTRRELEGLLLEPTYVGVIGAKGGELLMEAFGVPRPNCRGQLPTMNLDRLLRAEVTREWASIKLAFEAKTTDARIRLMRHIAAKLPQDVQLRLCGFEIRAFVPQGWDAALREIVGGVAGVKQVFTDVLVPRRPGDAASNPIEAEEARQERDEQHLADKLSEEQTAGKDTRLLQGAEPSLLQKVAAAIGETLLTLGGCVLVRLRPGSAIPPLPLIDLGRGIALAKSIAAMRA